MAFTPRTVPLSIRDEVASEVAERNRAAYPNAPPVTPEIPSDDVEVHIVEIPLESSNCPLVPEAFVINAFTPIAVFPIPSLFVFKLL